MEHKTSLASATQGSYQCWGHSPASSRETSSLKAQTTLIHKFLNPAGKDSRHRTPPLGDLEELILGIASVRAGGTGQYRAGDCSGPPLLWLPLDLWERIHNSTWLSD